MKIAVIGTGYVGLSTGTCFAEMGNDVICTDIDGDKIYKLNKREIPIYEPGLEELINRNIKRLSFSINIKEAIENSEIIICAVGTPSDENLNADTSQVEEVARNFGRYINGYKLFLIKSTIPVGTTENCKTTIQNEIKKRNENYDFDIAFNPEFLKQGSALKDTMTPERIIAGVENEKAKKIIEKLYKPFVRTGKPLIFTDLKSAEITKYAANAFLCTKISFINEMAQFCEQAGGNIRDVAKGIGLDSRIGPRFLHAGIGYGGNCLKKDINALINMGKENEHHFALLRAVEAINDNQKDLVLQKLENNLKKFHDKTVGIWGLTFKPKTDDLRDSPSIEFVSKLVNHGTQVKVYDPLASERFIENYFKNLKNVNAMQSYYEAVKDSDALVVLTEWDEFRNVDFNKIKSLMKGNVVLDGRNIYNPGDVKKAGLKYIGIGIN